MIRAAHRLLSLVLFAAAALHVAQAQSPAKTTSSKPAAVAETDKLDINTATLAQLKALKGVGDAYSKRIIDGRPYTAKNQLTSRGILPPATYDGIKDLIVARAVKK